MLNKQNAQNTPDNTDNFISKTYQFTGYADTLELYKQKSKDCPKGVRLKLQKSKYLMLQFSDPVTGKITVKPSGESFTDEGIINAVSKCWVISEALKQFQNSGDFWTWYDETVLTKAKMVNSAKTYREIFTELENAYFNGKNKNTKRKRSRGIPNDIRSFNRFYGDCFSRFSDWDIAPSVASIKAVVEILTLGTKTAKNANYVLRKIAELSHDTKHIIEYLNTIDFSQTVFGKKQSIDYNTFRIWYQSTRDKIRSNPNQRQQNSGLAWLWVAGVNVVYGLRPSEIFAAKNIDKAYTIDGITFYPITSTKNMDKLLYLGDKTINGCTTKTGARVAVPLVSSHVWQELSLDDFVGLPQLVSAKASCMMNAYRHFLLNHDCPVTQAYAFRHLANQLGELNGIPQEIRARSLGHSVIVNDAIYKKRSNIKTSVDLLTNHKKQPLPYDLAVAKLQSLGLDINSPDIQLILNIVYQLD